jgi:hypothetical protein
MKKSSENANGHLQVYILPNMTVVADTCVPGPKKFYVNWESIVIF